MRWKMATFALLALAACSKGPEGESLPDVGGGNAVANVAFSYGYSFELPSRAVADLQEAHAAACEQAGVGVCRITGMNFTVDRDGDRQATLSVSLASKVARRFGRAATLTAERMGATLTGANISGEEVLPEASAGAAAQGRSDVVEIDRQLADTKLTAAERAELRSQRAALVAGSRASTAEAGAGRERLASTPMSFSYQTGRGLGFGNDMRDALDSGLDSGRMLAIALVWFVVTLGPWLLAFALLLVLWRRWGAPLWRRFATPPAASAPPPAPPAD